MYHMCKSWTTLLRGVQLAENLPFININITFVDKENETKIIWKQRTLNRRVCQPAGDVFKGAFRLTNGTWCAKYTFDFDEFFQHRIWCRWYLEQLSFMLRYLSTIKTRLNLTKWLRGKLKCKKLNCWSQKHELVKTLFLYFLLGSLLISQLHWNIAASFSKK